MATSLPTTSVTLLDGLRQSPHDEVRWTRFVSLYGPVVYRLAKRKGLSREEAENVSQNFFLKMVRELPKFKYDRERGRFRSWVCTVALNEVRRFWREHRRAEILMEDVPEPVPDDQHDTAWWQSAESVRVLQLAMEDWRKESDERSFGVFRLLAIEQRSGEEVAGMFTMTRNQVYGIKFRKLARLRVIAENIAAEIGDQCDEQ